MRAPHVGFSSNWSGHGSGRIRVVIACDYCVATVISICGAVR